MIDLIGDPAIIILQYLDLNSLVAGTKVNQSWHDEILQHRRLWLHHYNETLLKLKQRFTERRSNERSSERRS